MVTRLPSIEPSKERVIPAALRTGVGWSSWLLRASVTAALLACGACDRLKPKGSGGQEDAATEARRIAARNARIQQACASPTTYDRLKEVAFDEARQIRNAESPLLDRLASATVVRMEQPVVKSRDESLNVTVCSGRLIIELPPGFTDAFSGKQRLVADIEYAAQAAADGSGLVYQMEGAEPIIYRLAAFDLGGGAAGTPPPLPEAAPPAPAAPPTRLAERAPPATEPPPRPRPAEQVEPHVAQPEPRPRPVIKASPPPVREALVEREHLREMSRLEERRTTSSRPSFNCRFARSRVEKMVCSSDRLAAMDRHMASLFYGAVAAADGPEKSAIRRSRDPFLRERDGCRSDACVAAVYNRRIAELERYGD